MNTALRNNMPEHELARSSASSDPAKGSWGSVEMLLASLVDEVRYNTWALIQINSKDRVPKPEPMRRPGQAGRRVGKRMSLADAQRLDPRLRGKSAEEAQAMLDEIRGAN